MSAYEDLQLAVFLLNTIELKYIKVLTAVGPGEMCLFY